MKNLLAITFLSILSIIPAKASNIADFMVGKDSYALGYMDSGKLQKSKIYTAIKSNLPAKLAKSDILSALYPSSATNGLADKDLLEAVFSVDVIPPSATDQKETTTYLMAFKLGKELTQDTLIKIITSQASAKVKLTVKKVKVSDLNVSEINYQENSLFVIMPDTKTIFASNSPEALASLTNRYKANKPIALPNRLTEQKKLVIKDSVFYAVGAVPPAISNLLQDEGNKLQSADETQSVAANLRTIIKNLNGATINASASDKLNVNTVVIFKNSDAANVLNNLVNQFMPLIKIQVFMMAQNNTQLPFLNTITNTVDGSNFVLNFALSPDDITGVLNLSQSNQKIDLNVNSI